MLSINKNELSLTGTSSSRGQTMQSQSPRVRGDQEHTNCEPLLAKYRSTHKKRDADHLRGRIEP